MLESHAPILINEEENNVSIANNMFVSSQEYQSLSKEIVSETRIVEVPIEI